MSVNHTPIASLSLSFKPFFETFSHSLSLLKHFFFYPQSLPSAEELGRLGVRSETSGELTVRSNLVGNAGSRPISEAKQPWACPVLGWGTTGEAHVLYSTPISSKSYAAEWSEVRTSSVTLSSSHLVVFCPPLSPPALLVPRSSFSSRPDLCFSAGSGLPWRCGSIPPGLSS